MKTFVLKSMGILVVMFIIYGHAASAQSVNHNMIGVTEGEIYNYEVDKLTLPQGEDYLALDLDGDGFEEFHIQEGDEISMKILNTTPYDCFVQGYSSKCITVEVSHNSNIGNDATEMENPLDMLGWVSSTDWDNVVVKLEDLASEASEFAESEGIDETISIDETSELLHYKDRAFANVDGVKVEIIIERYYDKATGVILYNRVYTMIEYMGESATVEAIIKDKDFEKPTSDNTPGFGLPLTILSIVGLVIIYRRQNRY